MPHPRMRKAQRDWLRPSEAAIKGRAEVAVAVLEHPGIVNEDPDRFLPKNVGSMEGALGTQRRKLVPAAPSVQFEDPMILTTVVCQSHLL